MLSNYAQFVDRWRADWHVSNDDVKARIAFLLSQQQRYVSYIVHSLVTVCQHFRRRHCLRLHFLAR